MFAVGSFLQAYEEAPAFFTFATISTQERICSASGYAPRKPQECITNRDVPRHCPLGGASFYHLPNYCCYKKGHKKQCSELFCSVANFYQLSCNFQHSGGERGTPPRPHKYLADYKRYQTNTLRSMSVCCAPQMMEDLRKLGSLPGVRQFLCNAIELLDSFVLQPIIEERKDLLCCLAMRFGGYKSDETRKTTLQADTSGSNDSSMKCFEHFN